MTTGTFTRYKAELRAAEYYRTLRTDPSQWQTLDDLEPLINEFEHLVNGGDYDRACEVINIADDNYLAMWNYNNRIVAMRSKLLGKLSTKRNISSNFGYLGKAYYDLGDFGKAQELSQKAIQTGDGETDYLLPQWLMTVGRSHLNKGEYDDSLTAYNKALEISRKLGVKKYEGRVLGLLGFLKYRQGDFEESIKYNEQAISILKAEDDKLWQAYFVGNTGLILSDYGRYEDAIKYHQDSLDLAKEIGNKRWEAIVLGDFGITYRRLGRYDDARETHLGAADISRILGLRPNEGRSLAELGKDHLLLNAYPQAETQFSKALDIAVETKNPIDQVEGLSGLILSVLLQGDYARASTILQTQTTINQNNHYKLTFVLGIAQMYIGELESSKKSFESTVRVASELVSQSPESFDLYYVIAISNIALLTMVEHSKIPISATDIQRAASKLDEAKKACDEKGVLDEYRIILDIINKYDKVYKINWVI